MIDDIESDRRTRAESGVAAAVRTAGLTIPASAGH
jgi:hypothetical protein